MAKPASIDITVEQARTLVANGVILKGATLYQTMGPHWREIIWVHGTKQKQCYVSPNRTVRQIRKELNL